MKHSLFSLPPRAHCGARAIEPHGRWLTLSALIFATCGCTQAATLPAAASDMPELAVAPLLADGPLTDVNKSGKPLNEDLTLGLSKRLDEVAKGRFRVSKVEDMGDYTLRGALSQSEARANEAPSYTLKLSLSDKKKQTLAQWVGKADNLRYLTDDLRAKNRIEGGLVGELSRRVARQIALRSDSDSQDFVRWADQLAPLPVAVMQGSKATSTSDGAKAGEPATFALPPRAAYQLRVPQGEGTFYLFALDAKGAATAIGGSMEANAGATVTDKVVTGLANGSQKYVVLLRRKKGAETSRREVPGALKPRIQGVGTATNFGDTVVSGTETVTTPLPTLEATGYNAILAQAASDAPSDWLARRVTVNFSNDTLPPIPTKPPNKPPVATPPVVIPAVPLTAATSYKTLFEAINQGPNNGLKVEVLPQVGGQKGKFHAGDTLKLRFSAPRGGYLIVVEMGTSGKVRSWFPETLNIDQRHAIGVDALPMALSATDTVIVPMPNAQGATFSLEVSDAGTQRFKAWLFSEPSDALEMIETLHRSGVGQPAPSLAVLEFDGEASQLKSKAQKEAWVSALKGAKVQSKTVGVAEVTLEVARADRSKDVPKKPTEVPAQAPIIKTPDPVKPKP